MAAVASADTSKNWEAAGTWASTQRWEAFRERRRKTYKEISARRAARRSVSDLTQGERAAHRNVPLEILAKEWLNERRASVEMRAYLVDKLLPTLVVGVEKLLHEVNEPYTIDNTNRIIYAYTKLCFSHES